MLRLLVLVACVTQCLGYRKEVYGFYVGGDTWKFWDWQKLTTVAIFNDDYNTGLIKTARKNNATVVTSQGISTECVLSVSCRGDWLANIVKKIQVNGLDGLNTDIEWPAANPSPERGNLTLLLEETHSLFSELGIPQLTFDVAWSPACIDGRCYDYVALSKNVDFFFVMMYDTQSQMGDPPCEAKPNSPIERVISGTYGYLKLGIPAEKLVLGLPWYGYDYPCTSVVNDNCFIESVPFRGSECSDAAGRQKPLSTLLTTHGNLLTDSQLDVPAISMRYDYINEGQMHRVWYDNPETLGVKYSVAESLNLRGVGMWNLECIYYGTNDTLLGVTKNMWKVLPNYSS